jgi:large subunit ribosomal protein L25
MDNVVLKATRRSVSGKQVKTLRRQGQIPAVMYGHNFDPIAISLDTHSTSIALVGMSSSAIVTIDLEGSQHAALVREKQRDYIKNRILHIDFLVVSLTETLRTNVSIVLEGESEAVTESDAVLVTSLAQVEVEALPRDLPEQLSLDITGLKAIGDVLYVRDLTVPSGVTILTSPDEIVVVAKPAVQELEEEVVEVETEEPEVIERGKKDDEEAEEE